MRQTIELKPLVLSSRVRRRFLTGVGGAKGPTVGPAVTVAALEQKLIVVDVHGDGFVANSIHV